MNIRAPAKINLSLRVLGKRPDGYHLLDTILVPVSLYDEIEIRKIRGGKKSRGRRAEGEEQRAGSRAQGAERRAEITVTCDDRGVPAGENNIVHRAARLLLGQSPNEQGIRIHIHIRKRIPVGAGLGGGSSDAAATLVGLNRLLKLRLSEAKLEKMALSLGADVPFFIRARPARARGIGERLHPIGKMRRLWLVIVYPGFPVSTAEVFRNFRATLTKPAVNTSIPNLPASAQHLARLLVNDLERVTLKRHPELQAIKEELLHEGAAGGLMSGSGSAIYGVFASRREAAGALRRKRKEEGSKVYLVHTLN